MRMTEWIYERRGSLAVFITAWVALTIEWYVGGLTLGGYGPSIVGSLVKFVGDGLLILLPYWFLPRRLRWSIILPVWLLSGWWVMNIWYARFWDDFLPSTAILMVKNMNGTLTGSVLALWKIADILYLIIPTAVTILYIALRRHIDGEPRFSRRERLIASLATVAGIALSQAAFLYTSRQQLKSANHPDAGWGTAFRALYVTQPGTSIGSLRQGGMTVFTIRNIIDTWRNVFATKNLSKEESQLISDYQSEIYNLNKKSLATIPDSIAAAGREKNLVLIVVESLNSEVLSTTISGHTVTPTLDSLTDAPGTISGLKMITQVKDGGSSDGQMLYNTGLLPLSQGAAAMLVGSNHRFNSLCSRLGRESAIILAEDGDTWNERNTFKNYGFRTIVSTKEGGGLEKEIGADRAMFRWAGQTIDTMRQPFFVEMITASMHVPFNDPAVEMPQWIAADRTLDDNEKRYLAMTHYFDNALGEFINYLKAKGLYDNTLLVIVSDHSKPKSSAENYDRGYQPIAFIAANTGITMAIDRHFGQVDVYPTLLLLLGITPDKSGYHGLGRLITDPTLNAAIDGFGVVHGTATAQERERMEKAYIVSDLILRDKALLK